MTRALLAFGDRMLAALLPKEEASAYCDSHCTVTSQLTGSESCPFICHEHCVHHDCTTYDDYWCC